ncbi:MAG: 30S ribosomal protein S27ae [Candidatus Woesearchaeota archaeon]
MAERKFKRGVWKFYSKAGEVLEKKRQTCLKCGAGVFMAKHANRLHCGKCGYTEFFDKK